jgi:uncharacterized protein YigE (DUF2233 family)
MGVFSLTAAAGASLRRLLCAALLGIELVGWPPAWAEPPVWEPLAPGLGIAVWSPGDRCDNEVPALYLVKVDPERVRFAIYHYRDERLTTPPTIQDWRRRTQALVLLNAGLFREDYSYLGLLFKNGRPLGSKRHPQWQGLFVAEPEEAGQRKARILDLAVDGFNERRPPYREAAQSLMLLDRTGRVRVRNTGKQAHQTVVAEQMDGQIVLIKSAGVVALHPLAECLRSAYPAMRQAMAMDGGSSSGMLVSEEALPASSAEKKAPAWLALVEGRQSEQIPLPAVIGLFPRKGPGE